MVDESVIAVSVCRMPLTDDGEAVAQDHFVHDGGKDGSWDVDEDCLDSAVSSQILVDWIGCELTMGAYRLNASPPKKIAATMRVPRSRAMFVETSKYEVNIIRCGVELRVLTCSICKSPYHDCVTHTNSPWCRCW